MSASRLARPHLSPVSTICFYHSLDIYDLQKSLIIQTYKKWGVITKKYRKVIVLVQYYFENSAENFRILGTTPITPTPSSQPRRRSVYSFPFFLRHQDAVEKPDDKTSPLLGHKDIKASQTLHPVAPEESKPKRGSVVRRKRSGSVKSRPTSMTGSGCHRTQSEKCTR